MGLSGCMLQQLRDDGHHQAVEAAEDVLRRREDARAEDGREGLGGACVATRGGMTSGGRSRGGGRCALLAAESL